MVDTSPFAATSLCVVGNINRDLKVDGVPGSPRLLRDGETSVAGIIETVGGGGANSACAAAALGARAHFVGKVGADPVGAELRRALEGHRVRTHLAQCRRSETGTTVALGFLGGHRHFLSRQPNNESLSYDDLDLEPVASCHHLLRADVWFSRSMLAGGNRRLLEHARRCGVRTSVDINFDPCWGHAPAAEIRCRKRLLREVLELVDIAHGNTRELCEFADAANLKDALQRLSRWGAKSVVVHLGTRGAGYWTGGKLVIAPADLARAAVHSTGTGDVLSVCMILLEQVPGLSTATRLRLSNRIVREFMEGRRTMLPSLR